MINKNDLLFMNTNNKSKRVVLVVDDVLLNREILKSILESYYKILEASNGQEAIEILRKDYENISAVILDLMMPIVDGYEVLKIMNNDPELAKIPVLVSTGADKAESEIKALALGAHDYIRKPYNRDIIIHRVHNIINLRETSTIANIASVDYLTGLYNRSTFFAKAKQMISEQEAGYYIMASFDINGFKVINDQYGSEKGDEILRKIANVFIEGFKDTGAICCRMMADNFAVLYPNSMLLRMKLDQIRDDTSKFDDLSFPITYSIGRYIIDDLSLSVSDMYERAVIAKASVKGHYDTHIGLYHEDLRQEILKHQAIISEMNIALENKEFEVWYQPQYNHEGGALIGAEALVRWRHSTRGLVPPNEFIPLFEKNGFIYQLDKYVWEEVCSSLREWIDEGRNPLPISVNLSRYDLLRLDIIDVLNGLLVKYNLPASLLRLEITESAFSESTEQIISVVRKLQSCGFYIEVDDFGSGYSSLNTLKDVSANVLKLDMRFLENSEISQRGGIILESVARMAKWLGMSVIAEGVETLEQANYLKSIGCVYVQGYLYGKPMIKSQYELLETKIIKERKLATIETVDTLNNTSFWDPISMDTLIFNSYVGGACILEYHNHNIEVIRANEKYAKIFGDDKISLKNAMNIPWNEMFVGEEYEKIHTALKEAIGTDNDVTCEIATDKIPGIDKKIYLRVAMRVIAFADKRYLIYCRSENITAQREAEEKLKQTAEQLQIIMRSAGSGIIAITISDDNVKLIFANHYFYKMFGYTEEQFEKEVKSVYDLIHIDDREKTRAIIYQVQNKMKNATLEYRAITRDGKIIWVNAILSTASFQDHSLPVQISVITDVTDKKKNEAIIKNRDEQLVFLNQAAHDLLTNHDFDLGLNQSLDKLLDYFQADRSYIIEIDFINKVSNNTYERCAEGVKSEIENLQGVSMDVTRVWFDILKKNSYISIEDVSKLGDDRKEEREILMLQGIKSIIAVPIQVDDSFIGFLGIDDPKVHQAEVDKLKAIGDYVASTVEKRNLQTKIEKDNKLLTNMMNDVPGGFVRLKVNEKNVVPDYINQGFCQLVDMKLDEIMKMYENDAFAGVHPDDVSIAARAINDVLKYGLIYSDVYRLYHRTKGFVETKFFARKVVSDDGDIYLNVYYYDLSDKEKIEFQRSQLLDNLPCGAGIYDLSGDGSITTVYVNRKYEELVNRHVPINDKTIDALESIHPDERAMVKKLLLQALSSKQGVECNIRILSGKDKYVLLHLSTHVLKDNSGKISVYITYMPINEKTENYQQMLALSLAAAMNSSNDLLFIKDKNYRYVCCSDKFCKAMNMNETDIVGKTDYDLLDKEIADKYYLVDEMVFTGRQPMLDYKDELQVDNNETISIYTSKYPLFDRNGQIKGLYCISNDEKKHNEALEKLKELTDKIAGGIASFEVSKKGLKLLYCNDGFYEYSGYSKEEYLQLSDENPVFLVYPDDLDKITSAVKDICKNRRTTAECTYRRFTKDKKIHWFNLKGIVAEASEDKYVINIVQFDITEQLKREAIYQKWQLSLHERPLDSYTLFHCNLNKNASYDSVQGSLIRIKLDDKTSFNERNADYAANYIYEEDVDTYISLLNSNTLLANYDLGIKKYNFEYREIVKTGHYRWIRLSIELVEYPDSSNVLAYFMYENIDEEKKKELQEKCSSQIDPLTGAYNRKAFISLFEESIRNKADDSLVALLMFDIDEFKLVNDSFGHVIGDQALIDIVGALHNIIESDGFIGRLGGDEFLICLQNVQNKAIIGKKATAICNAIRKSFSVEVKISASVGITVYPEHGSNFEELYYKSDLALYHIKGIGKDAYAFYDEDMTNEKPSFYNGDDGIKLKNSINPELKRRMLIVEDNKVNRELLVHILKDDYIIDTVDSGNLALTKLRQYASSLSVVILDLNLPDINGITVLEKMRSTKEIKSIPIIVVTGIEEPEISLKAIKAGASDFITKPVNPYVLKIRVESAISKAENERLRTQNRYLTLQSKNVSKYKAIFEDSNTIVIEYDEEKDIFTYDELTNFYLAGTYDDRGFFDIILEDHVADVESVEKMKAMFSNVINAMNNHSIKMKFSLLTPTDEFHLFGVKMLKHFDEFFLSTRVIITLTDLDISIQD